MKRVAAITFFLLFLGCAMPAFAQTPKTITGPRLIVPIPGLDFREYPAIKQGDYLTIPFLSAYISGIYRYIVGASVAVAAVMIVYGGFQYIVGSSMARVGTAKKIIADAVIGLILILGIYTILETINPETLNLKGLKVQVVKRTPIQISVDSALQTRQDTATPAGQSSEPIQVQTFTECPFTLEHPLDLNTQSIVGDARNKEFFEKVKPYLTGATFQERMAQLGEILPKCGITLGSCGSTSAYAWALAGGLEAKCLQPKSGCLSFEYLSKHSKAILGAGAASSIKARHCSNDSGCPPKPGCTPGQQLINEARNSFPAAVGGGYPESWAEQLKPGDWIYYYNGNRSCSGEHSVMFIGWASDGLARTLQGPGFKKLPNGGTIGTVVIEKNVCLTRACGSYMPMTLIQRPKNAL